MLQHRDRFEFEWSEEKAEANYRKHGVRFVEGETIWLDERAIEIADPDHSHNEERWLRIGLSSLARLLIVVYVEKIEGERIRIISARKATRLETANYRWRNR